MVKFCSRNLNEVHAGLVQEWQVSHDDKGKESREISQTGRRSDSGIILRLKLQTHIRAEFSYDGDWLTCSTINDYIADKCTKTMDGSASKGCSQAGLLSCGCENKHVQDWIQETLFAIRVSLYLSGTGVSIHIWKEEKCK